MDPYPSFLHNVIDNRPIFVGVKYLLNCGDYGVHVISGDAGNGLNLIFKWSVWIVGSKFKHYLDLVLANFAGVGLALDVEFLRVGFFDSVELL